MTRNIAEPSIHSDFANLAFRTRQLERASHPTQYEIKIFSDTQAVVVGDSKFVFVVPIELNGSTLFSAQAFVTTAASSGLMTVQVSNLTSGFDLLSTPITIDVGEYHSYTADTPSVVDTTWNPPPTGPVAGVSTGDRLSIDVDIAGTGAKGLGVILRFGRFGYALPAIPDAPVPSALSITTVAGSTQTNIMRRRPMR